MIQNMKKGFTETFTPLRNRNLTMYLSGQTISQFGTFMQATAQTWVIWQISRSTAALGLTAMLGSVPMLLFGAIAGVWADRLDRRKVLISTQVAAMLLAFIFAILLQTHLLQIWHIYVLSFTLGCVSALDMPSQNAFIGDLSSLQQVREATVLNSMVVQVSRMVGPALAGWALGALGEPSVFWLNGASFLVVIGSLMVIRTIQIRKAANSKAVVEIRAAFSFLASEPRAQDILILAACISFFGFAAGQLLPAIVTDYLHAGPAVLGIIMGASGAGALAGALFVVPSVQRVRRVGWIISGALAWMGVWLVIAIVLETSFVWTVAMFLCSISTPVVLTTSTGLLQVLTPPIMRARILAVSMMVTFGILPLGYLLVGLTGQILGPANAILLNAGFLILIAGVMLIARSGLRRWVVALPGKSKGSE